MTKREMFTAIANVAEVASNKEMSDFIAHEIELLDRKGSRKTPTKTQKENVAVMNTIMDVLKSLDAPATVSELIAHGELSMYTNQKISALLRKLVNEGKVAKTIEKKVSRFAITDGPEA